MDIGVVSYSDYCTMMNLLLSKKLFKLKFLKLGIHVKIGTAGAICNLCHTFLITLYEC